MCVPSSKRHKPVQVRPQPYTIMVLEGPAIVIHCSKESPSGVQVEQIIILWGPLLYFLKYPVRALLSPLFLKESIDISDGALKTPLNLIGLLTLVTSVLSLSVQSNKLNFQPGK